MMFDRSPAAFKPRLFQGFGSTVLVAASLFCGAAQASVTATLVQNSASTSSGVLTGTGALLNSLTAPQFDISTGINGGVSTGATFTSESNLTGSLITFRNGLISSGTNSSSTVGVAITFTNDQTFSYRPTLHSTLLAAGIGIGMSSIRLGGTNDPATTTLECTMTQLKNCGTYTPTQGYGPYSLGDFGTAKAGFDFDVSVAGASIYNLTGEMQNTGNTISQSFTRVANGISTTSANGGDFLSGYTADRNDATGRAFSWGDTGVDITLPDLLAPGQSVTAIYTITTVANGGTGGVTLFPGGRITGINSLAFSSFGDPVGGGSTISNDGLPGGPSSTGGISTSGYSIFALPTEMVDAVHQTVTANFSGHTTSVANDHPYDSPTAGPAAAPVPEPAMLGLFGLGAAGVIGARFRRKPGKTVATA